MDSDEEHEHNIIVLAVGVVVVEYYNMYLYKAPVRDSILSGNQFVHEVLRGHPIRCYDKFRMNGESFLNLSAILRKRNLLQDSRWVCVEEQLAIFLFILGHNERNRVMQERFQLSGETISRYFNDVLMAIVRLSRELIRPPSFLETPPEILQNPKYYPWFKDCIGAIDGTHIKAIIPSDKQLPFINRKGVVTQNVMAACSFDLRFAYVYAGWEGSANDSRILWEALRNKKLKFPHPPEGKYYVVNAGYPNMPGFLAPYRCVRYHLQDYRNGANQHMGPKELFNYAYSSLRNAIERAFGVVKAHFPILKEPAPYPFATQRYIFIAACAIHNFIRMQGQHDELFSIYEDDNLILEKDEDQPNNQLGNLPSLYPQQQRRNQMSAFRNGLADAIYLSE